MPSTKEIGDSGENRAVSFLKSNNYTIVARNFRTRQGEIDIIALKDEVLAFVEVKTLPSGNFETLSHELNERKQKRILETAKIFLLNNRQYNNSKVRFDVAVIDMPGLDTVYYIKNAFSEFV